MHIPQDIQNEIYNFVNYLSRDKFRLLDKYWNQRHTQFLKNITLIQQSYRKYRIPDSYLDGNIARYDQRLTYIHANSNNKSSVLIRRYYLAKYPFQHLVKLPESLANSGINSIDRSQQLLGYIEGMPSYDSRTNRHIKNFLDDNNVTKKELSYYGW